MQEVIIADTSCLILLTKLNLLEILREVYGEVSITSVISKEYNSEIPSWIRIVNLDNDEIEPFITLVDKGEASAIALARRFKDCLLILDDNKARNLASQLKINFTGTIGVLLRAKEKGYIPEIKSVLAQIKLTNFYISPQLEQLIIKSANE